MHGVFLRPHPPIIAPEPYNAMYDPAAVPMPRRAETLDAEAAQHPYLAYALKAMAEIGKYNEHYPHSLQEIDELEIRQLRATYYGMISQVDDQIGRLIAHLKKTGEYDRTLIIFTCDHGEMLGDHWLWGKHGYFDQAYHIPLIIRDPRMAADDGARGAWSAEFTEAVDLMPTILDWLGLDAARSVRRPIAAAVPRRASPPPAGAGSPLGIRLPRCRPSSMRERALGLDERPVHAQRAFATSASNTSTSRPCRRCSSISRRTRTVRQPRRRSRPFADGPGLRPETAVLADGARRAEPDPQLRHREWRVPPSARTSLAQHDRAQYETGAPLTVAEKLQIDDTVLVETLQSRAADDIAPNGRVRETTIWRLGLTGRSSC